MKKNATRFISGFLACFISVVITQIVYLCFVGAALLLLLGVTLHSVLAGVPLTHVGFRESHYCGTERVDRTKVCAPNT